MDGPIQMEEGLERIPNLELCQQQFLLQSSIIDDKERRDVESKLLDSIKEKDMAPFYQSLCEQKLLKLDSSLLKNMQSTNAKKLQTLEEKIADAEKNEGENELREALLAKAEHFARIGDKDLAVSAFRATYEKTIGSGQRLDIVFYQIRIGFFSMDWDLISRNIDKAQTLVEEGGDWDRRNRLKVYEGLLAMSKRDFAACAKLFLEAIATFTSYELFTYEVFVKYTALVGLLALERVEIKKKILDCPEILSLYSQDSSLQVYMLSLHNCEYAQFFSSLTDVTDEIHRDRYLSAHASFYCREMRIKAYQQKLASYRSVTMESMADDFGVSVEFLDKELSRFTSTGRLNCEIDKVGGVIETTRPDEKNAQYQAVIKQGDLLLNRVQRLASQLSA